MGKMQRPTNQLNMEGEQDFGKQKPSQQRKSIWGWVLRAGFEEQGSVDEPR